MAKNPALLPDRHPTKDFFICDVLDAVPKDDMASMQHPIFSLSTKPDTRIRRYEHNNNTIEVIPSARGLATIHDKDILIYCISQLMTSVNKGERPPKTLRLKAYDLLVATNRLTNGGGYQRLKDAFERLTGTQIVTDVLAGGERIVGGFSIISDWNIILKDPKSERMVELEVTLSKWIYNAILSQEVLSINRDYFRLRKPLERRLYELARKHCGSQREWSIGERTLMKKCGSSGNIRDFRRMLKELVKHDHLPDYRVTYEGEKVTIYNRNSETADAPEKPAFVPDDKPVLKVETYERAKAAAPGLDIYYLEQEWLNFWHGMGKPELHSPDAAFIGFCKRRYEQNQ